MLGDRTVTVIGSVGLDEAVHRVTDPTGLSGDADWVVVADPDPSTVRATVRRTDGRVVAVVSRREAFARALGAGATDVVVDAGDPAEAVRRRLAQTARDGARAATGTTGAADTVRETVATAYGAWVAVDDRWTVTDASDVVARGLWSAPVGRHFWRLPPQVDGAAAWRLRAAMLDGTPRVTRLSTGDRTFDVLAVPGESLLLGLRDTSGTARIEAEHDRLRRLFETIDDGIYTVDEDLRIRSVNEAVTELTGYDRSELVGEHSSKLATPEMLERAAGAIRALRDDDGPTETVEGELERADGTRLPIETRFSTMDDGVHVGVVRDATAQRAYEETLQALNGSARSLLTATDTDTVWQRLVETGRETLGVPAMAAYRFDETANELRPVAVCADTEPRELSVRGRTTAAWRRFADGATRVVDPSDVAEPVTDADRPAVFVSVSDHGLLVAEVGDDDPTDLLELLAANGAAALDRLQTESQLTRHERRLSDRAAELERINRFNELVKELNAALVDATTRSGIERAVCDRLVETEGVALAWIAERSDLAAPDPARGAPVASAGGDAPDGPVTPDGRAESTADTDDPTTDDGPTEPSAAASDGDGERATATVRLSPRAVAGAREYVESQLADPTVGSLPAVQAAATGEPVVVSNAAERLREADWPERALRSGFRSVVSVPLRSRGHDYGVLTLYADHVEAFDDPVGETLAEFGGTIATAIAHVETRSRLAGDTATQLRVRIESADPPAARIAAALDAPIRVESATPLENGTQLCLTGDAVGPDAPATLERLPVVRSASRVGSSHSDTLVVRVREETVSTVVADEGGVASRLAARPSAVRATVELPPDADVADFLSSLRDRYASVTLTARESTDDPERLPAAFYQRAARKLTDRQLDVLRTSHAMGYFAWPRDATGERIAESLDIAQPTFSKHLRTAQRKLLDLFFDRAADE